VSLLQPYVGRGRKREWYRGTADAVLQNLEYIDDRDPELVLVLAGDHVYKMDYRPFIALHRARDADLTVAVRRVPLADANRFGILEVGDEGRVTHFVEKPDNPTSNLVSMGVYAFRWPLLREVLSAERLDFGRDVLPAMVQSGQAVHAYEYQGYWQDIGTVDAYWQASMDLVADQPPLDLYETGWLIYTRSEERAPAHIGADARVTRSLVSHGCIIEGAVDRSILSPGVRVGVGAVVRESIVMFDTEIGPGAVVDRAIIDKQCVIGANAHVGDGRVLRPNRSEPERLFSGLTLVGKQARVPAHTRIGRNCRIDPSVTEADFPRRRVAAGDTVVHAG
jgi:glucose-1-phosphate adenylyltransferase